MAAKRKQATGRAKVQVKSEATAETRGEGRLTKQVLRQRLRRGKGPLISLGAGLSSKSRDPEEIKRGLR
jgi:hypothetical protein